MPVFKVNRIQVRYSLIIGSFFGIRNRNQCHNVWSDVVSQSWTQPVKETGKRAKQRCINKQVAIFTKTQHRSRLRVFCFNEANISEEHSEEYTRNLPLSGHVNNVQKYWNHWYRARTSLFLGISCTCYFYQPTPTGKYCSHRLKNKNKIS